MTPPRKRKSHKREKWVTVKGWGIIFNGGAQFTINEGAARMYAFREKAEVVKAELRYRAPLR